MRGYHVIKSRGGFLIVAHAVPGFEPLPSCLLTADASALGLLRLLLGHLPRDVGEEVSDSFEVTLLKNAGVMVATREGFPLLGGDAYVVKFAHVRWSADSLAPTSRAVKKQRYEGFEISLLLVEWSSESEIGF